VREVRPFDASGSQLEVELAHLRECHRDTDHPDHENGPEKHQPDFRWRSAGELVCRHEECRDLDGE